MSATRRLPYPRPIPNAVALIGFAVAAVIVGCVYGLEALRERVGRRR